MIYLNTIFTPEFLTLTFVSLLAIVTPGADFALVVQNSILYSRKAAFYTAIGIGLGISVHLTYILFGFGYIVTKSSMAIVLLKYVSASYLLYLGIKSFLNPHLVVKENNKSLSNAISLKSSIKMGFLNNILNVPSAIFLLSVFSIIITPETPAFVQFGYGLWRIFLSLCWFSIVILFFTHPSIKEKILSLGVWFKVGMGISLCFLSIKIFFSTTFFRI